MQEASAWCAREFSRSGEGPGFSIQVTASTKAYCIMNKTRDDDDHTDLNAGLRNQEGNKESLVVSE